MPKRFFAHPGVKYTVEDELAMLDVSYLLEQILSGDAKIKREQDLSLQFVEVVTGSSYQPQVFNNIPVSTPTVNLALATQAVSITPSGVTMQSTVASVNIGPGLSLEVVQQMMKEQEERLNKHHQDEIEAVKQVVQQQQKQVEKAASKEEMASVQERLAAIKKQVSPKQDASGGNMAQAQLNPIAPEAGETAYQPETTEILTAHDEQLRQLRNQVSSLQEERRNDARLLSALQDKTGLSRGTVGQGQKRLELAQYTKGLEDQKKQKEADARAQQKLDKKRELQKGLT